MKTIESQGSTDSSSNEKELEREMIDAVKRTLNLAREVPQGIHGATGIDVRNGRPSSESHQKDSLAVYPNDNDNSDKLYLRHMKTGGRINGGERIRAYEGRERHGKREGQYVQVTTDYESKDDRKYDRPKGSTTTVHVYDKDNNLLREKKHTSEGVGLSPLVTKIVTKGVEKQVQNIKETEEPPTLFEAEERAGLTPTGSAS